jgi:predicted nucleotidyltransferase
MRVIERRRQQQRELLDIARRYVAELRQRIGPLSAWVYGSVARGDFNQGSDVDLLIVAPNLPDNPLARMEVLYAALEPPVEPKGYTPGEWQSMCSKGRLVTREVSKSSVVIVDDLGLAKET